MIRVACAAALAVGFAVAGSTPVLAADPTPTPSPLVFHNPQYLVFMESHDTVNGRVTDDAYWLFVAPPDENGHLIVPTGSGPVFHYQGRLVGGPFRGETDACPAMLGVGVASLQAWAIAAGEEAQIADCTRFEATPPPAGAVPAQPTVTGSDALPSANDDIDAESLGLAIVLLGMLLFGGGAGLALTGRTPEAAVVDPGKSPDPAPDPCAQQADAVHRASVKGRYLNDLLATCRRHEDLLQEQIDVLANLVLPGSVLMDLGFAAGGLSGGLSGVLGRKLIASETFKRAIGESVVKDLLKELGKQALGSAGGELDPGKLGQEGGKSAVKQSVLEGIGEGIVNKRFFDTIYPSAPNRVFRNAGEYVEFTKELKSFADDVAGPIKDGLGAMIDLYEGVSSGLEMKERLDDLRARRDRIADKRAELEIEFEDALADQRFAAERLSHCRKINSPDWRP